MHSQFVWVPYYWGVTTIKDKNKEKDITDGRLTKNIIDMSIHKIIIKRVRQQGTLVKIV